VVGCGYEGAGGGGGNSEEGFIVFGSEGVRSRGVDEESMNARIWCGCLDTLVRRYSPSIHRDIVPGDYFLVLGVSIVTSYLANT